MVKIKTCFKWKGANSSGILRMEVTLFSGFELNSIPPLLLNPQVNMTEMLHGFYDNNLWFVFANVTSDCPVCVQYSVRSGFVISSIRPAYARIYPVSREDLAADTFFHTPVGSSLLRDITEDDLFTWFKHNGSSNKNLLNECLSSTEASSNQVNTNTQNPTEPTVTQSTKIDEITTVVNPTTVTNQKILHRVKLNKEQTFTTPKHVNTKKQDVPSKYLQNENKEEELPATFAPEIKNDRYVLLDKEQLWGMLKEVVNDEINKKIKLS